MVGDVGAVEKVIESRLLLKPGGKFTQVVLPSARPRRSSMQDCRFEVLAGLSVDGEELGRAAAAGALAVCLQLHAHAKLGRARGVGLPLLPETVVSRTVISISITCVITITTVSISISTSTSINISISSFSSISISIGIGIVDSNDIAEHRRNASVVLNGCVAPECLRARGAI
eukprot:4040956-Pleurochrysis_carterae.AAC.1